MELFTEYLKHNSALGKKIDTSQLMELTQKLYLKQACPRMNSVQMSGFYWLCQSLGSGWDTATLNAVETRLIELLQEEIEVQKQLDSNIDEDVPEGLQTWTLSNI